nr:DUF2938 family protein [Dysgonomonas sp. ZJ709]
METIIRITVIGIRATLLMDMWSYLLSYFNIKTLDYRLVGRWIGNFFNGKFIHENITRTPTVRYEAIIGWSVHYFIGIIFSFVLVACFGIRLALSPDFIACINYRYYYYRCTFFHYATGFWIRHSSFKTEQSISCKIYKCFYLNSTTLFCA